MNRGQAQTLEAFTAAVILIAGLIFATQATAVTPLSASTSNQHIENQNRAMASDLLTTSTQDGELRDAIVYWNTTRQHSYYETSTSRSYYVSVTNREDGLADHPFGETLDRTFGQDRIAYNIDLKYREESSDSSTDSGTQALVDMGEPSDNAVTATHTVVLYNTTTVSPYVPPGDGGGETLESLYQNEPDRVLIPYAGGDDHVYNVVEVRITVWQM